jgi:hypothetical protein
MKRTAICAHVETTILDLHPKDGVALRLGLALLWERGSGYVCGCALSPPHDLKKAVAKVLEVAVHSGTKHSRGRTKFTIDRVVVDSSEYFKDAKIKQVAETRGVALLTSSGGFRNGNIEDLVHKLSQITPPCDPKAGDEEGHESDWRAWQQSVERSIAAYNEAPPRNQSASPLELLKASTLQQ